ncbi:MAG: membrane protein FxsA [Aquamicrobium sp.]|nr:membrane protein FxsA [Aquamicrobium sp.]
MPLLPLILLALPLVEIAGFALIGSLVGVLPTVALALATTVLGAVLLRIQGLGALTRIRATMDAGGTPGRDLVHGLMIGIAGLLLVVPGFFTDALGLLLFLPPVRELVWRFLRSRIVVVDAAYSRGTAGFRRDGSRTIDLDAEDFARKDGPPPRRPLLDGDD